MTKLQISIPQDSGNIDICDATNADAVKLAIRPDGAAAFHQWFYFRVSGAADTACRFEIGNAGSASYVDGWQDYRVCCSYDLEEWFRLDTEFDGETLSWAHTPSRGSVYYAYFAPYPIERYRRFVGELIASDVADYEAIGPTLDGEPLDLFRFGPEAPSRTLWVIARQHPGETMGSFWMEGFLDRLCDPSDAVARALLAEAAVYIVPLVNIDGARRGHLRTNAAGQDLNRAWADPSAEKSPEVLAILNEMDRVGCDLFMDVHGDEAIANNFIAGAEGVPSWNDTQQQRLDHFKTTLATLSPAFQVEEGYPVDAKGTADMRIACHAIAERFECLSMTLEMPFKDAKVLPDRHEGWSPDRCRDLGRACLDAMWQTLPGLKD